MSGTAKFIRKDGTLVSMKEHQRSQRAEKMIGEMLETDEGRKRLAQAMFSNSPGRSPDFLTLIKTIAVWKKESLQVMRLSHKGDWGNDAIFVPERLKENLRADTYYQCSLRVAANGYDHHVTAIDAGSGSRLSTISSQKGIVSSTAPITQTPYAMTDVCVTLGEKTHVVRIRHVGRMSSAIDNLDRGQEVGIAIDKNGALRGISMEPIE